MQYKQCNQPVYLVNAIAIVTLEVFRLAVTQTVLLVTLVGAINLSVTETIDCFRLTLTDQNRLPNIFLVNAFAICTGNLVATAFFHGRFNRRYWVW